MISPYKFKFPSSPEVAYFQIPSSLVSDKGQAPRSAEESGNLLGLTAQQLPSIRNSRVSEL